MKPIKAVKARNEENMEWALYKLIQDNQRLRNTATFYMNLAVALQRKLDKISRPIKARRKK